MIRGDLFIDCGALLLTASTCTFLLIHRFVPLNTFSCRFCGGNCLVGTVTYFHSSFQPFIRRVVKLPFLSCSSLPLTLFVALSGGHFVCVYPRPAHLKIMCSVMFTLFFRHPSLPGPPLPSPSSYVRAYLCRNLTFA